MLFAVVLDTPSHTRKLHLRDAADAAAIMAFFDRETVKRRGAWESCTVLAIMPYDAHKRRLRAMLHKAHARALTTPEYRDYLPGG